MGRGREDWIFSSLALLLYFALFSGFGCAEVSQPSVGKAERRYQELKWVLVVWRKRHRAVSSRASAPLQPRVVGWGSAACETPAMGRWCESSLCPQLPQFGKLRDGPDSLPDREGCWELVPFCWWGCAGSACVQCHLCRAKLARWGEKRQLWLLESSFILCVLQGR